ncbi:MAG: biotin/lipoyl-binding protein, partial [Oscillospiraceae bacterium]|nr:biotin/lipoyl-binding protein [Oscillospiraceae bacterium]
ELGANIPGMISKLHVSEGEEVKKNDVIAIIEAMKMETAIVSNEDGIIDKIHVKERQAVKVKELLVSMRPK